MHQRFSRWIEDLGFLKIVCTMGLDPVLSYVASCHGQEVDWSSVDLEDAFVLYRWSI